MPVIENIENQLATINPWLPLLAKVLLLALCMRVGLYWMLALRRAREGVRHFARNLLYVAAALYLVVLGFWLVTHVQNGSPNAPIIFAIGFVFLAAGIINLRKKRPARKRYIPARMLNAVKARDLGNRPFDPNKHHVDHIWPFSKGGSHTMDNLRVIAKTENLRKGAKRPRLRDLW
jgi:hypothetical protein